MHPRGKEEMHVEIPFTRTGTVCGHPRLGCNAFLMMMMHYNDDVIVCNDNLMYNDDAFAMMMECICNHDVMNLQS